MLEGGGVDQFWLSDLGGVGQFWLDGRGALRDKIESNSRAISWFQLGEEFIVSPLRFPAPTSFAGKSSHHRVTEARRCAASWETASRNSMAFWYRCLREAAA